MSVAPPVREFDDQYDRHADKQNDDNGENRVEGVDGHVSWLDAERHQHARRNREEAHDRWQRLHAEVKQRDQAREEKPQAHCEKTDAPVDLKPWSWIFCHLD